MSREAIFPVAPLPIYLNETGNRQNTLPGGPGYLNEVTVIPSVWGWEPTSVQFQQPPHPRPERSGSIMQGDGGIQAVYAVAPAPLNWGFETQPWQPFQPPAFTLPKRGAAHVGGDVGAWAPFVFITPHEWGFEIQPFQPPHRFAPQKAQGARGKSGFASPKAWVTFGGQATYPQPPQVRSKRLGAVARGDDGNLAAYSLLPLLPKEWGFEPNLPLVRYNFNPQRIEGTRGKVTFAVYASWLNAGWEFVTSQPVHPRVERSGALARGDEGNLNSFQSITIPTNWGMEVLPFQPPAFNPKRWAATVGGDPGTLAPFLPVIPKNWGFEIAPFQPPYNRGPQRVNSGARGGFAVYPAWINAGWEMPLFQPPHPRPERAGAIRFRSGYAIYPAFPDYGWFVAQPQPPHPRPERSGALARGDEGNLAPFTPVAPFNWGFENIPFQPPAFLLPLRGAAHVGGDFGAWLPISWTDYGWWVDQPQPPHPRPERSGALARGDEGDQFVFSPTVAPAWGWGFQLEHPPRPHRFERVHGIHGRALVAVRAFWVNAGWEPVLHQPQHPRPERTGAIAKGDEGIQGRFSYFRDFGWPIQPPQPPHPRPERFAGLLKGDDGTAAGFQSFADYGWFIQPPQPPQPRHKRAGAIMRGEDGVDVLRQWYVTGWEIAPVQPPHPRPERVGSILRGEDGVEGVFQFIFIPYNWGFEIQPFQPPAYTLPKRGPAIFARGDEGIELPYVFVPIPNNWFDPSPWQPPHPRPERAGAILRGDDGVDVYRRWLNAGWESVLHQPRHPRPERSGAIAAGDSGTENVFRFVTIPNNWFDPLPFQPRYRFAPQRIEGTRGRALFAIYRPLLKSGWEPVYPQPPHPRRERSGALAKGDEGITKFFVQFATAAWFDPPPWQPPQRHTPRHAIGGARGGFAVFPRWLNSGFESLLFYPPSPIHRRTRLIIAPDESFGPYVFVAPVVYVQGWDVTLPELYYRRSGHALGIYTNDPGPLQPLTLPEPTFWITAPPRCIVALAGNRSTFLVVPPECVTAVIKQRGDNYPKST